MQLIVSGPAIFASAPPAIAELIPLLSALNTVNTAELTGLELLQPQSPYVHRRAIVITACCHYKPICRLMREENMAIIPSQIPRLRPCERGHLRLNPQHSANELWRRKDSAAGTHVASQLQPARPIPPNHIFVRLISCQL